MSLPSLDDDAPAFELPALTATGQRRISLGDLRGSWVVVFFYPADFSFVCPTEVRGFARRYEEFRQEDAEVLGISPDDIATHQAWSKELGGIPYPLLSDAGNTVAVRYGACNRGEGRPDRATFIVDPEGKLLFAMKVARNVGRSVSETLRILQALRSGRLCPADWHPGDDFEVPA
jgi:peroxiredoxin (alkyl hydroperoxide reductase subunit C)